MSTGIRARPVAPVPPPTDDRSLRRFLGAYAVTVLAMAAGVVAVQVGWQAVGLPTWPVAAAVLTAWAAAVGGVLRACGWNRGALAAVIAAPAVVLTLPAAAGWLSPDALVLWGPVTTVLAAGVMLVHDGVPLAAADQPTVDGHGHDERHGEGDRQWTSEQWRGGRAARSSCRRSP